MVGIHLRKRKNCPNIGVHFCKIVVLSLFLLLMSSSAFAAPLGKLGECSDRAYSVFNRCMALAREVQAIQDEPHLYSKWEKERITNNAIEIGSVCQRLIKDEMTFEACAKRAASDFAR